MEPFTHAFASVVLSQTARGRLPRFGMLMVIVGGVAPGLDSAGYLISPGVFFRLHRAALHSFLGATVLSCALAYLFVKLDKKLPFAHPKRKAPAPLTFRSAFLFCAIGVAGNIFLDLASTVGVELFWPFYGRFYGADLVADFDVWVLAILVLGLLLPLLIGLVNDEIAARGSRKQRASMAAIVTLVLLCGYFGLRADLRARAVRLLVSRDYSGREPDDAKAFPTHDSPFVWRGVVETGDTMEVIDVPVLRQDEFASAPSLSFFKPAASPALQAAEDTPSAKRFLLYAREPFATSERQEGDYRVEMRDLRFSPDDTSPENLVLRIEFSSLFRERYERFHYATVFTP